MSRPLVPIEWVAPSTPIATTTAELLRFAAEELRAAAGQHRGHWRDRLLTSARRVEAGT